MTTKLPMTTDKLILAAFPHSAGVKKKTLPHRADRFPFINFRSLRAFSLLEVMIALGIFFMAVFAILGLVSNTLSNARSLERPMVDAGLAAAIFTNTNRFYEGTTEGDFGDDLPGYSWYAETYEYASNGLVQADIVLEKRGSSQPAEALSILMFDPNFKSSSLPRGH